MDFSLDVFDCVAANSRQMFASLKEGDRTVVMAETGAVSSGSSPFCNIGKRTQERRADARAWARAGGPGSGCARPQGVLLTTEFFFMPIACLMLQVMDCIPR